MKIVYRPRFNVSIFGRHRHSFDFMFSFFIRLLWRNTRLFFFRVFFFCSTPQIYTKTMFALPHYTYRQKERDKDVGMPILNWILKQHLRLYTDMCVFLNTLCVSIYATIWQWQNICFHFRLPFCCERVSKSSKSKEKKECEWDRKE